jgi:hypothetical protein
LNERILGHLRLSALQNKFAIIANMRIAVFVVLAALAVCARSADYKDTTSPNVRALLDSQTEIKFVANDALTAYNSAPRDSESWDMRCTNAVSVSTAWHCRTEDGVWQDAMLNCADGDVAVDGAAWFRECYGVGRKTLTVIGRGRSNAISTLPSAGDQP